MGKAQKALAIAGMIAGWASSAAPAASAAEDPKETNSLSIGAFHEFGQVHKGVYTVAASSHKTELTTNDWLDHFAAFVSDEAILGGRLHVSGGMGGIFEFRKPELPSGKVDAGFSGAQRKAFFAGPTDAQAVYYIGADEHHPWLKIGGGMFTEKYNPEAYNLGEFLFRSGAYPTYTVTGGYALVNNAAATLQGFKSNLDLGAFQADIFFTTETSLSPLYDWSLAALAGYTFADGLVDIGAGVDFKRLVQVKPSRTAPRLAKNGYFTLNDRAYSGNSDYYSFQSDFYRAHGDSLRAEQWAADAQTVQNVINDSSAARPAFRYFSGAGTLLMGRACIDPKKILGSGIFGPEDLKLYGEVAVLGLKNYPVFFTKITQRMPVMVGFNLPGYGLLDLFAIQAEYMDSPWLNNTAQVGNGGFNIPAYPLADDSIASAHAYNDMARHDNFKWSILLKKKFPANITLSGQVADDHLRLTSSYYYYGPQFDHNEVTAAPSHWYWMTQLAWGI